MIDDRAIVAEMLQHMLHDQPDIVFNYVADASAALSTAISLQPNVVNAGGLVLNMDELLRRAIGDRTAIETIVAYDLWNTLVDPNQLENVILNLAINARDAMGGEGTLTIKAMNAEVGRPDLPARPGLEPGQYVLITVSDSGVGMSPEVIDRAFEPFFTTKPEGQGTGLGLSMAYGFMKQSGGHIQIESTPGQGTTVKVYLPRARRRWNFCPASAT